MVGAFVAQTAARRSRPLSRLMAPIQANAFQRCILMNAHSKVQTYHHLDKLRPINDFLEKVARDYIEKKESWARRGTDEEVIALLGRRFGTGSNKIHIQQQFRTLHHTMMRLSCNTRTRSKACAVKVFRMRR